MTLEDLEPGTKFVFTGHGGTYIRVNGGKHLNDVYGPMAVRISDGLLLTDSGKNAVEIVE